MSKPQNQTAFARFRRLSPQVTGGLLRMRNETYKNGTVPGKYKILTALAIAVATRCEPCIKSYIKTAYETGVTEAELIEFLNVAITMQGCPGEEWAVKAFSLFEEYVKTGEDTTAGEDSCCAL